jgi:hypothetical protein
MSEPVEIKCCHGCVVVQPGDRLVIAVDNGFDFEQAKFMAEQLEDIQLVFVNASNLAVQRNSE